MFVASKEQQKIINKLTEVVDAESFLTGETTVLNEDGFEFPIEFYVNAMKGESGKAKGFVIIAHDITKRNQMEEELSRYSEKLEELVEKRTKALKESQELLVKSERLAAIGQAATMVGHDLRNPLQAIENAAFYLNNEFSNIPDSSKIKETVQVIHRSIDYADNIVNDLLCFASTRKAAFLEIDINDLIKETLLQINIPKNVKTVTELDVTPRIVGDKQMLKRVFVNLALNGIQAMEEKGGTLKIETKKVGDYIEMKTTDNGIGIKDEYMQKIFTPFFTTKAQGMGVGLAICKRFVEIHEGTIEVESKEGEGSIFTIKLPIKGTEVKKVTKHKPRILIVEDDENIRETIKNILEQSGYDTDVAKTGQEAERKTQTKFYNLALLDIKLPDMEGTKLLAKVHDTTPKMVKIMLTGYPSLENAMEALNQGADAYVTKPVKPAKLLALIEEKLEKQSKDEQMTESKVTDWIKTRARQLEDEL